MGSRLGFLRTTSQSRSFPGRRRVAYEHRNRKIEIDINKRQGIRTRISGVKNDSPFGHSLSCNELAELRHATSNEIAEANAFYYRVISRFIDMQARFDITALIQVKKVVVGVEVHDNAGFLFFRQYRCKQTVQKTQPLLAAQDAWRYQLSRNLRPALRLLIFNWQYVRSGIPSVGLLFNRFDIQSMRPTASGIHDAVIALIANIEIVRPDVGLIGYQRTGNTFLGEPANQCRQFIRDRILIFNPGPLRLTRCSGQNQSQQDTDRRNPSHCHSSPLDL